MRQLSSIRRAEQFPLCSYRERSACLRRTVHHQPITQKIKPVHTAVKVTEYLVAPYNDYDSDVHGPAAVSCFRITLPMVRGRNTLQRRLRLRVGATWSSAPFQKYRA